MVHLHVQSGRASSLRRWEMRKTHWRTDEERIEAHRAFFARFVAARAGVSADSELAEAFRTTPRERFVGGPPWRILTRHGFVEAPRDDPAFLYQDVVVSLDADGLNNGEPSLHAMCIATLRPMKGDRIVHVGAGTGYYTTILAKLVGELRRSGCLRDRARAGAAGAGEPCRVAAGDAPCAIRSGGAAARVRCAVCERGRDGAAGGVAGCAQAGRAAPVSADGG